MKLITLYQSAQSDGYGTSYEGLYRSQARAKAKSHGGEPRARLGVEAEDGSFHLIESGPHLADDDPTELRRRALAKLTDEEVEALGLGQRGRVVDMGPTQPLVRDTGPAQPMIVGPTEPFPLQTQGAAIEPAREVHGITIPRTRPAYECWRCHGWHISEEECPMDPGPAHP